LQPSRCCARRKISKLLEPGCFFVLAPSFPLGTGGHLRHGASEERAVCVNRLSLSLVRPLHRGCKNKSRTPSAAEKLLARRGRCFPGSGTVAPRAYWKGYLKLSLVSCPIALSPAASSSERISFRQINKKTGN